MAIRKLISVLILSAVLLFATPALAVFQVVENPTTGEQMTVWSSTAPGHSHPTIYVARLVDNYWTDAESFLATNGVQSSIVVTPHPSGGVSVAWGTAEPTGRVLMRTFSP